MSSVASIVVLSHTRTLAAVINGAGATSVRETSDTEAALAFVRRGGVALIVIDLDVEGMSAAAVGALREAAEAARIVGVGSAIPPEVLAELEAAGLDAFVLREFGAELRLGAIAARIQGSRTTGPAQPHDLGQERATDGPSERARTEAALREAERLRGDGAAERAFASLEDHLLRLRDPESMRMTNKALLRICVEDLRDGPRAVALCQAWRRQDPDNGELAEMLDGLLARIGKARQDPRARSIAHDLQEPLRSIRSYLRVFRHRHEADLPAEALELVDLAATSAEDMERRVAGALGKPADRTSTPFDARAVVAEMERGLDNLLAEHRVRLDVGPMPTLVGDREAFGRVLQNLVVNAVRHGSRPGATVSIRARAAGSHTEIVVEDGGPESPAAAGPPPPLSRADSDTRGHGLGLGIVADLAAANGASVRELPSPRGGRCVCVAWPGAGGRSVA